MAGRREQFGGALGVSAVVHATLVILAILLIRMTAVPAIRSEPVRLNVQYFPDVGPIGGGGGQPVPAPPRAVEVPRHAAASVVAATLQLDEPRPRLDAPIQTDAARVLQFAGSSVAMSTAPGGGGPGTGAGPGRGPGFGPGGDGGFGGGARRAGGDIVSPVLLRSVSPQYTTAAMIAKTQGTVELEAVVLANGRVGDVRIIRSLDRAGGLDAAAVAAARQWIFRPGTERGQPIDVLVTLVLDFRLH
jgi:protein TonB